MCGDDQLCPFRHMNRLFQLIAELPVEVESRREDCFLPSVRVNQLERHVLAAQVHVRHEPGEIDVLFEFQLPARLEVRGACRNRPSRIAEMVRRHDYELPLCRGLREGESNHGLVCCRLTVGCVMNLKSNVL